MDEEDGSDSQQLSEGESEEEGESDVGRNGMNDENKDDVENAIIQRLVNIM